MHASALYIIALLSGFTASAQAFTAVLVMKAIEAVLNRTPPASASAIAITAAAWPTSPQSAYLAWHTKPDPKRNAAAHLHGESNFEPGSRSACNSITCCLPSSTEALFQQNYKDLLEQHITEPVGLTNTFFDPEASADSLGSRSYLFNTTWEESPTTHLSIPLGAGGIITTLVHFNNVMGRIYFLPVKPFHGCIIRTTFKKWNGNF